MKRSFCKKMQHYLPIQSEVEDLFSTAVANCVFNSFLSYTAIMLNIVTIHAIRKTSSLPKTLKTLLLSLAISDVGVGLFVQPFYTSLLVMMWLQEMIPTCRTYKTFAIIGNLFAIASFLGVVAVSVDRFLAIHLHLRYQELVTRKRVDAVVISIWMLSIFVSFSMMWVPLDIYSFAIVIIGFVGLILTTMVYIKLYKAVKRHENQIQVLRVQQVAESYDMANFSSLIKSAVGIFYVYLVVLVCYFPYVISLVVIEMNGLNIKRFYLFSTTLTFLTSSLNPVIYCWKMRHIRHAVVNILRNISWHNNRALRETLIMAGHTLP